MAFYETTDDNIFYCNVLCGFDGHFFLRQFEREGKNKTTIYGVAITRNKGETFFPKKLM